MGGGRLLIYGANGYTGALVARYAAERGLDPILAGRSAAAVDAVARKHGFDVRIFGLDVPSTLDANLDGVGCVLHCAGPFSRTSKPMVDACLRSRVHYLDVTGELEVFEATARRHSEAEAAGVMLMPGCGFDVVPSDCLALHVASLVPGAKRLELAFRGVGGGMSHGTATTMVESLPKGSWVRRGGKLEKVRPGSLTRKVDFGRGPTLAMAIPWGDLGTAWRSTGIPDITVYTAADRAVVTGAWVMGWVPRVVGSKPVQAFMKRRVDGRPAGPTDEQLESGVSLLWARAENDQGLAAESRLTGPQGYKLTALASLNIAEKVLRGELVTGYQTPATAYGADLVLEIEGVTRDDVLRPE
ncbi:MAG: saccharopine dehydrogenase NADP-binding domain-containing protein [Deltaproteobacteria bacterium]|nr:saccharopine dehydrogenase NADP-binding domain-containing protein [Deltaproteobacteria bacterium]